MVEGDEPGRESPTPPAHSFKLGMGLFLFWLMLSGSATPLLLTLGALSSVIVVMVTRRMRTLDQEAYPIHLWRRILPYWLWLSRVVMKANVAVIRSIIGDPAALEPQLVVQPSSQATSVGRATYGNSLTLTPGTVALWLGNREVQVHALMPSAMKTLNEMDLRVAWLEGSRKGVSE